MAVYKNDFEGRAILVTGAGSGLGRSIAELLSQRGATVVAIDCDAVALGSLKDLPNIRALVADLRDATSIGDVVACAEVETLNGVVNCAAVTGASSFEALPLEEGQRVLAVNLSCSSRRRCRSCAAPPARLRCQHRLRPGSRPRTTRHGLYCVQGWPDRYGDGTQRDGSERIRRGVAALPAQTRRPAVGDR